MKKIIYIIPFFVVFFSCSKSESSNKRSTIEKDIISYKSSVVFIKDTLEVNVRDQEFTTSFFKRKKEKRIIKILNKGDYANTSITLKSNDSLSNFRISQVIYPDGSADGPFSKSISIKNFQTKPYQLIVNENIMAGDPWEGELTLIIKSK